MTEPMTDTSPQQAPVVDFFNPQVVTEVFYLDRGSDQYVTIKKMSEGDRYLFQQATNTDLTLNRRSEDAKIKVAPEVERQALIIHSIVDWRVIRKGNPVAFSKHELKTNLLPALPPNLVDDLEKACRKLNPFLTADVTVEDIDKQIKELEEQRANIKERDAGN